MDFFARCWELYLAYNFIHNSKADIEQKSKSDGPDFKIKKDDQLIHVEAICPKNSLEVMTAYESQRKSKRAMSPPDDEKCLVITGALSTKIKQYHERIEKGVVQNDTPYIIAINAGDITFADYELLVSILFEVGSEYIVENDNLIKRTLFESRKKAIYQIANKIYFLKQDKIIKVAIDGVDGAGKSVFAEELKLALVEVANNVEKFGLKEPPPRREVIHSSVDGFHNPRETRYRKGKGSPEGFFEDSYNYSKLKELLLGPLSDGGDRFYSENFFDHKTDEEVQVEKPEANKNSILLIDGIFLHRKELRDYWDYSIFLDVEFKNSVARCAERDNSSPDLGDPSNRRYVEGQKIYIQSESPKERATLIFDNNNLERPKVYGL